MTSGREYLIKINSCKEENVGLDAKQELALQKARDGKNIFISGSAGKGKSYTVNKIKDNNTIFVAPTAIAAMNVQGSTLHRTLGLPIGIPTDADFMKASRKVRDLFSVYSPVKRIVFSEFGMMRMDMFEVINSKLQTIRGNNRPFGGISVIAEGDCYQLPPIVSGYEEQAYYERYNSPFAFDSEIFDFEVIELDKVYRQNDKRQIEMLNSIRIKDKYYKFALDSIVKEAKHYVANEDVSVLCCYRKDVAKYNRKYFRKLSTPIFEFKARITNITKEDEWKDAIIPSTLQLREGAKVIFKANDEEELYINGEKGEVVYVDKVTVVVRKSNGQEVSVKPFEWERYEYRNKTGKLEKEVTSKYSQLPLQLAYATSIHSSQSQTLDEVAIDIGAGCFDSGMLYTALSRVRDLRNLSFVRPPSYEDVIVDKRIKDFYRRVGVI